MVGGFGIEKEKKKNWQLHELQKPNGLMLHSFFILRKFTPSDVPLWDAWVSATAWAGMWLLAKRKLENWLVLNLSNAFAIPLQFHKNIPMYGLLTIVLFVVAIFGYLRWKKLLQSLAS
jgi:nicotinamide mononucleotide transporter